MNHLKGLILFFVLYQLSSSVILAMPNHTRINQTQLKAQFDSGSVSHNSLNQTNISSINRASQIESKLTQDMTLIKPNNSKVQNTSINITNKGSVSDISKEFNSSFKITVVSQKQEPVIIKNESHANYRIRQDQIINNKTNIKLNGTNKIIGNGTNYIYGAQNIVQGENNLIKGNSNIILTQLPSTNNSHKAETIQNPSLLNQPKASEVKTNNSIKASNLLTKQEFYMKFLLCFILLHLLF